MKTIQKSVLIWYSAQEMFDVVRQVERYPQFLPWCDAAQVVASRDDGLDARISLSFAGIRQAFTTRNLHVQHAGGDFGIDLSLLDGPFSVLQGRWTFAKLPGSERACKVQLVLSYDFSSAALAAVVGPVFDGIASSLVDAFVTRAESLYDGQTQAQAA
jgi:ribosome-associated toxin RatA of RatAB toxin-antitoxin module